MAGSELMVEYVGGPKDGERAALLRLTPHVPKTYVAYIRYVTTDEFGVEHIVGRYVRDHMRDDESAMRYVWTWTSA